jgi:hypothetical protein
MKLAVMVLVLATSVSSGTALAQDKPAFVFTAIPDQDETRLVERLRSVREAKMIKLHAIVDAGRPRAREG